jgi:hypothetical protein
MRARDFWADEAEAMELTLIGTRLIVEDVRDLVWSLWRRTHCRRGAALARDGIAIVRPSRFNSLRDRGIQTSGDSASSHHTLPSGQVQGHHR